MHMLVHLLVYKTAQNDSIIAELERKLYVALGRAGKISLKWVLKSTKNWKTRFICCCNWWSTWLCNGEYTWGYTWWCTKNSPSNLHQDAKEGAFEIALKSALEVCTRVALAFALVGILTVSISIAHVTDHDNFQVCRRYSVRAF